MAWQYSDKTKLLFINAVNGDESSHFGELVDADGVGEHGSIACGDAMKFYFRVQRADNPLEDRIVEAKYSTFGCTSAIASSEALCEIIVQGNYTPIEALKIRNVDIVRFLEGLPSQKVHCSVMGAEALQAAVLDWSRRRGVDLKALGVQIGAKADEESRVVCKCFNVTENEVKRGITELNLRSIEDITNALKAGGACGSCHFAPGGLQDLLDEHWGAAENADESDASSDSPVIGLSPFQLAKKIEGVIDAEIRPMLQSDEGDMEIVDIKEHLVYIKLLGKCATCPGASATIQHLIEKTLRDKVDQSLTVIDV
ncbi:MAG: iron-sulfur cluster assembly scaffold protein [Bradymonadales bacterium]